MYHVLKPYSEYIDSDVPWLGKIPMHWDSLPCRALFSEIEDQGHIDEPLLSVTITRGIIPQAQLLVNSSKKDSSNLDKTKYKRVLPNDIAYNKMRAWQGAIGVSKYQGIVSPAYVVVRLRRTDSPDYFHYLLRTPSFIKEAERWSYGIASDMWSLRPEHFKMIYLCVPKYEEQTQIVRFLDWKTTQINKFIHNKQRLIELLKEQKQNIINQAVTRGLDPNVKLKPSGVEWIGDIPEHWEASQLKNFLSNNDGGVWGSDFGDDGVVVLRSTEQTVDGEWRISDPAKRILTEAEQAGATLSVGDLLVTKSSGSPSHIGKTTLVTDDVAALNPCFSNFMQRLRARPNVEPRYLWLYMNSWPARTQLQYLSNSTTGLGNLSSSIIGGIIMLLPPKPEQRTILSSLKNRLTSIELAIQRAMTEITLIQEYRTRLISDAVTGQIDVRHIKVPKGDVGADLSICLSDDLSESDYPIEEDEMLEVAE